MRTEFSLEGMAGFNAAIAEGLRKRSREAVRIGGEQLKSDLRTMTAGPLGNRIAKAWRLNFYGMNGDENPAAYVYSNAPAVIRGNMENITIVPRGGSQYFAIPTDKVPQRRGRGAKSKMSPEEVEAYFNQDMILRKGSRPGTLLGFVEVVRGRSKRRPGYRQSTRRRLAQGRKPNLVLMFTFARSVRKVKTIDPNAAFRRAAARTKRHLQNG